MQNTHRDLFSKLTFAILIGATALARVSSQFSAASTSSATTAAAADVGLCVGSSAAAKLLSRFAQAKLRQPRFVQIELQSTAKPWLDSVAHVESRNRITLGQLQTTFKNNLIEAKLNNVTLKSALNIYLLPLPFFLGKDTAHVTIKASQAALKMRALHDFVSIQLDECTVDVEDMDVRLDNAPFLNAILNPMHRYLLPRSVVRDSVCSAVEDALTKWRRRIAIEFPLVSLIPPKFAPYMLADNISLFLDLEALNANEDQLTVSAKVEWTESAAATSVAAEILPTRPFFEIEPNQVTSNVIVNEDIKETVNTRNDMLTSLTTPATSFDTVSERLQIWVRDSMINELFEHFHWDFEWIEQQILVDSPKIPQSTRSFLSTLCTNCYFLLRVTAHGAPHVQVANSSIMLKKSDQIFMKVVNPTRNVDAVFVNFALTLSIQLTPIIEAGVFRTQVDLLDTKISMQEGAFPSDWRNFVQDLVRGMIVDVIWPSLKKEIEYLSYSDGVQIPIYCGLEPSTAQLHFDDGRIGASASLHLDDASLAQCLQQVKSKLPDPSKLLVIREKRS